MIEYILSVSLLIVAVLIIRAIFRKTISPKVIYALWLVVVIRMVLPISLFEVTVTVPEFLHTEQNGNEEQSQTPPMLENGDNENDLTENIPIQTLPITPIIPGEQEQIPPAALPVTPIAPSEPEPVIPNEPDLIEPSTPGPETPIEPEKPIKKTISFTYVDVINTVWLAGVLAVEWWVIFTASSYEEKLRKNRKFYKNIGRTKVYISESADVPCVAGVIPSVYITPESVNSGNDDLIMLHEYCHIRHGDHIWSVVRALALIVFWWNPLVWIAAGVSKRDAELACDDSVASKLSYEERIKYANILIDTIPQKRKYAVGLGSAPMKERIIMLTTEKKNKILCIVLAIILALCAVGCSFTSFGENETTQQNPETVPPAEDTEPDDTDADTESDVQTEKDDSNTTEPYIAASGEGYVYVQPGGKLTISSDVGFEFVQNFREKPYKQKVRGHIAELTIEGSVISVPENMFSGLGGMRKVVLGDGVRSIGDNAFSECISLREIQIPYSVSSIGSGAFSRCESLEEVYIPNKDMKLGSEVFASCTALRSINLPINMTEIPSGIFENCNSLLFVDIPDAVTSIADGAFRESSIKQISIPNSVTNVGNSVFSYCENLSSIYIPDSVISIGKGVFYGCKSLEFVKLPKNMTKIQDSMFFMCEKLSSVDIPDSVTVIGNQAFRMCTSLTEVAMGDNVETIEDWAFRECTNLTDIKLSKNLKNIDEGFQGCTKLEHIDLPEGLESMRETFYGCTSLKSIEIPESVTERGELSFAGCTSLTSIEVPGKMFNPHGGHQMFSGCTNLKSVIIKDGATSIGAECMASCTSLEIVEIPNSVKSIDFGAFRECISLKEIRFKGTEAEWNAVTKADKWDLDAGNYTVVFKK